MNKHSSRETNQRVINNNNNNNSIVSLVESKHATSGSKLL